MNKIFTIEDAYKVWEHCFGTENYAHDVTGTMLYKHDYGSKWEIDHIVPSSRGGSDNLDNLRPLNKEDNRLKSDKYPKWTDSNGNEHIE